MTDRMLAFKAFAAGKPGFYVVDSATGNGVAGPFEDLGEVVLERGRVERRDAWPANRLVVSSIVKPKRGAR